MPYDKPQQAIPSLWLCKYIYASTARPEKQTYFETNRSHKHLKKLIKRNETITTYEFNIMHYALESFKIFIYK